MVFNKKDGFEETAHLFNFNIAMLRMKRGMDNMSEVDFIDLMDTDPENNLGKMLTIMSRHFSYDEYNQIFDVIFGNKSIETLSFFLCKYGSLLPTQIYKTA